MNKSFHILFAKKGIWIRGIIFLVKPWKALFDGTFWLLRKNVCEGIGQRMRCSDFYGRQYCQL